MICRMNRILCLVPFLALGCGNDNSSEDREGEDEIAVCGDGQISGSEVCDTARDDRISCIKYDITKRWKPDGFAGCSADCASHTVGTCILEEAEKPLCGNGLVDKGELCDIAIGIENCSVLDEEKVWESGGKPFCGDDCLSIEIGTCKEKPHCGNGRLDPGEACDDSHKAVPCSEYDNTKDWIDGGAASCYRCLEIEIGTCREAPRCGDGIKNGEEVCDAKDGVPKTCAAWNNNRYWKTGGSPVCSADCTAIEAGTCAAYESEDIVYMNWNVLYEYDNHNGEDPSLSASVDERATKLVSIIGKYQRKPDFMSIVEVSPAWHSVKNTEKLRSLGYEWAINEKSEGDGGREPLSDVIYLSDKYDMIGSGFVNLLKTDGSPVNRDKNIALYAVLENKKSHVQYIIMSTHWDANNIWSDTDNNGSLVNTVGWVTSHELNRIRGAKQSAELVSDLRGQYPNARFIYGGDLNTIDLDIIFGIDSDLRKIIATAVSLYLNTTISLADLPSLISSINGILSQSAKNTFALLPDDFIGSLAEFESASGLTDARSHALSAGLITSEEDTWSTSDPGIPDAISSLGVPIVIDYAFFSANNMQLTGYKIMTRGDTDGNSRADYMYVSDHFPVRTTYITPVE